METIQDVIIHLTKIEGQINRLASDWESEKRTRKERNNAVDYRLDAYNARLHILEIDKVKRDTTINLIIWMTGISGTAIGAALTLIINHFLKK